MNKRTARLLPLGLAALLLFTACGGGEATSGYTSLEMAELILESQDEAPEMVAITAQDAAFAIHLDAYYKLEAGQIEDGAVFYAEDYTAHEIAVLKLADPADAEEAQELLLDYIDARIGEYYGYMAEQVSLLEQASVVRSGSYVALLVCPEPEKARQALDSCFQGENSSREALAVMLPVSVSAVQPSGYEPDAVLAAWRSGDASGLSWKNQRILNACADVIEEVIREDMSDYEMELAIHDWMIHWAEYDAAVKSRSPLARPDPDNDNPYGLLIGRRAICSGYTDTFQLFMDMLEIPCITVNGAAYREANTHAWNMVRLDGEWYCVDVTWDDPIGLSAYDSEIQHSYFNVTSDVMRESKHIWDESLVPEATATRFAWGSEETA